VALVALLASGRALAAPSDPLLAHLIAEALATRPELQQAEEEHHAEEQRARQATALPDPTLQVGVQNDSFTRWEVGRMETSFFSITASETFPWPGKLDLRGQIGGHGAHLAEQNLARLRLSTEADVRRAYLNLLLARERLELLNQLEGLWRKSAATARSRYESGQGPQSDVLRAQLELNRLSTRRWLLQVDADSEVQSLNRLRGHALDDPLETTTRLADLPLPESEDLSAATKDATEASPELRAAHVAVQEAGHVVELAGRNIIPDLTVTAGVMPRGGPFPPMWLLSVGSTLPIFAGTKQDRSVEEARARLEMTRRGVETLEQIVALRTAQRHTALAAALKVARLFREGLLVQSEATVNSTLAQYQVGKVPFSSVLEANAGLIADRDAYLQALVQAHRLRIDEAEVNLGPLGGSADTGSIGMPQPRATSAATGGSTSASSM
jgi:outer membrane protein TolC